MRHSKKTPPETRDRAQAVAAWASSRTPDEVGTIADAIWGLAQKRPGGFPELAEGARAVLANAHEDPPHGLVLLAALLEQTAERLRAAADALRSPPGTLDGERAKTTR